MIITIASATTASTRLIRHGKVYAIVDPENGCSIAIEDLFPDEESIDLVFDGDDWYEV